MTQIYKGIHGMWARLKACYKCEVQQDMDIYELKHGVGTYDNS